MAANQKYSVWFKYNIFIKDSNDQLQLMTGLLQGMGNKKQVSFRAMKHLKEQSELPSEIPVQT